MDVYEVCDYRSSSVNMEGPCRMGSEILCLRR